MSRQARELFILMLLLVIKFILLVVMINDDIGNGGGNHFDEIPKFWTDFGAGNDFLGVALVEYIDKRWMFGLDNTTNR